MVHMVMCLILGMWQARTGATGFAFILDDYVLVKYL
jgi:hypothetical protein